MKNMIYTTVRKPSFMVKMALITVLFIAALIEQVSNTGLYANSFGTQEHMTVILLLIHTFSYSDFYQNIFFIGFPSLYYVLYSLSTDNAGKHNHYS